MSLEQILSKLKKEYLNSFGERIQSIEDKFQEKDWEAIISHFHNLKGTGKTYGLPEISVLGQALEALCKAEHVKREWATENAILILKEIVASRLKETEFPLKDHPSFQKIQELYIELR